MNSVSKWRKLLLAGILGWICSGVALAGPAPAGTAPAAEAIGDDDRLAEQARQLRAARPALFGEARGILVVEVARGGQAESAGLQRGDILLGYADEWLSSVEQLVALTRKFPPERAVRLKLIRDGKTLVADIHGGRMGTMIRDVSEAETALSEMQRLNKLGLEAQLRADYPAALAAWQEGLDIARIGEHKQAISAFHGNIGMVYRNLGQYEKALEHFRVTSHYPQVAPSSADHRSVLLVPDIPEA